MSDIYNPETMQKALIADPANGIHWLMLADERERVGPDDKGYTAETAAIRRTGNALEAGKNPAVAFTALIGALPETGWVRETYANWVESLGTGAVNIIAEKIRRLTPEMIKDPELAQTHWHDSLLQNDISFPYCRHGIPQSIRFAQAEGFLSEGRSVMRALPADDIYIEPSFSSALTFNAMRSISPGNRRLWAEEYFPAVIEALKTWPEFEKAWCLSLSGLRLNSEEFKSVLSSEVIKWNDLGALLLSHNPVGEEGIQALLGKKLGRIKCLCLKNTGMNDAALRLLAASGIIPQLNGHSLTINENHFSEPLLREIINGTHPKVLRDAAAGALPLEIG